MIRAHKKAPNSKRFSIEFGALYLAENLSDEYAQKSIVFLHAQQLATRALFYFKFIIADACIGFIFFHFN